MRLAASGGLSSNFQDDAARGIRKTPGECSCMFDLVLLFTHKYTGTQMHTLKAKLVKGWHIPKYTKSEHSFHKNTHKYTHTVHSIKRTNT